MKKEDVLYDLKAKEALRKEKIETIARSSKSKVFKSYYLAPLLILPFFIGSVQNTPSPMMIVMFVIVFLGIGAETHFLNKRMDAIMKLIDSKQDVNESETSKF